MKSPRPGRKNRRWQIPVTVIHYGGHVLVEGATKREAMQNFRERRWIEQGDFETWKITKVGPCEKEPR